jgi:flagellar basal-body rod protein FlgB
VVNSFERTVDLLHRGLDANVIRRNVIADNMANADVPNFKRSEVTFESELKRALDTQKQRPALELALTDPKHIPNWRERDYREVQPRRVPDYASQSNTTLNTVDPDQELNLALENQMIYTLLAQSTAFQFSQISSVLRG